MTGSGDQLVAPRDANWAEALPPARGVTAAEIRAHLSGARRLVVLDDDPTGTQTVRDVPVLTRWDVEDVRWALRQGTPGFYVLTNTRSLSPAAAAERNREVAKACLEAARLEDVRLTFASRGTPRFADTFPSKRMCWPRSSRNTANTRTRCSSRRRTSTPGVSPWMESTGRQGRPVSRPSPTASTRATQRSDTTHRASRSG